MATLQQESQNKIPAGNQPSLPPAKIWDWIDFLLIFIIGGVLVGLGGQIILGIVSYLVTRSPGMNQWLSIEGLVITEGAFVVSVLLVAHFRKHQSRESFGFRAFSKRWIWWAVGLAIGLRLLVYASVFIAQWIFKQPVETLQSQALFPQDLSWIGLICLLLLVGFIAPLAEEVFFRGFFYSFLRERWGIWIGAAISAFIFALFHFELIVVAVAFVLGLTCSILYERSHSLWSNIFLHMLYNLLGVVPAYIIAASTMHLPLI